MVYNPATPIATMICQANPWLCQPPPTTTRQPSVTTSPTGQVMVTSQSTLDKLLTTALQSLALLKGSPYIPTTTQPQQQPIYQYPPNYSPYATNPDSGAGATFGAGLEKFVKENTGLLLIGGVAFVLFKSGRK